MQKEQQKTEVVEIPRDIREWVSEQMAEYSDNENNQISFYDGFEATYKKLTEKPPPVIETGEQKGDIFRIVERYREYVVRTGLLDNKSMQDWLGRLTESKASHPSPAPIVETGEKGEIPEEIWEWMEEFTTTWKAGKALHLRSSQHVQIGKELAEAMYHKMQSELAAANAKIKELQDWVNSHI